MKKWLNQVTVFRSFVKGEIAKYIIKYNKYFILCALVFNIIYSYNQINNKDVYIPSISNLIYIFNNNTLMIFFIMISTNISLLIFIYFVSKDKKLSNIFSLKTSDADSEHEILIDLITNINHEVKTPIMVLAAMIEDVKYEKKELEAEVEGYTTHKLSSTSINTNNKPYIRLKEEFTRFMNELDSSISMGGMALDQINNILDSLLVFKEVKFATKNLDIYTLIKLSMTMLKKTKPQKFKTVYIDKRLKQYTISNDTGMTDSFFVNLILNHAKNSLEADAYAISFTKAEGDKGLLNLHISDNGKGIPEENIKNMFKLYSTSKSKRVGTRGTGLYTNKLLLTKFYKGDLNLVYSKIGIGTIFSIKLKVSDI